MRIAKSREYAYVGREIGHLHMCIKRSVLAKWDYQPDVLRRWYETRQTFLLDMLDSNQKISPIKNYLES